MVILRLIGILFVVAALMMLGADVITTLEKGHDLWSGDFMVRSLDQVMALFNISIKQWADTTLPDPVSGWLDTLLSWPGWADTGVLGVLLGFVGSMGE
jgi:hypothetical protein